MQEPQDLVEISFERAAVESGDTRLVLVNDVGDLVSNGFVYLIEFSLVRSKCFLQGTQVLRCRLPSIRNIFVEPWWGWGLRCARNAQLAGSQRCMIEEFRMRDRCIQNRVDGMDVRVRIEETSQDDEKGVLQAERRDLPELRLAVHLFQNVHIGRRDVDD